MDMNDDVKETLSGETSASVIRLDEENGNLENAYSTQIKVIREIHAEQSGYWADLLVEILWSASGNSITCKAKNYRAKANGQHKGNIYFRTISSQDQGWIELNSDNASQDGNWRSIGGSNTVSGNASSAEIGFWYTYDRSGVSDIQCYGSITVSFTLQAPSINAIKNVPSRTFPVTGTGGISGATIIFYGGSTEIGRTTNIQSNGNWTGQVTVQTNKPEFRARQRINNKDSAYSNTVTVYVAAITAPAPSAHLVTDDVFRGIAAPGSTIKMVRADNHYSELADPATATSGGIWEAIMTAAPPSGPLSVEAQISLPGFAHGYTAPVTYTVLGAPAITAPAAGTAQPATFTLSGNNGLSGATVDVFIHPSQTKVGTGTVLANGTWTAIVTLAEAGPVSLAVSQTKSNKTSIRGAPRAFGRGPDLPTLSFRSSGDGVVLHGTGDSGARMDVHFANNAAVYFDAMIVSGTWAKDIPAALMPAQYTFRGRQSISDGGSGRLYSGWADNLVVDVPTPRPTDPQVVVTGQKPTFSGKGGKWGSAAVRVNIYNDGELMAGIPQATVQTNLNWTTTASADLPPGLYSRLTARQGVNHLWSTDTARFSMTIASPPPVFTKPVEGAPPTGQRPQIQGTAWPNSAIVLKVPGKPDEPLTATGGSFTLDADSDWPPGTYELEATAEFGGQISTAASRSFTVKTPTPTFTTLPEEAVDLVPIIKGKGWPGCWMVIYSAGSHQPLGSGPVDDDGDFEVTLNPQPTGVLRVYAIQEEYRDSDNVSVLTATLSVNVTLRAPLIEVPSAGGKTGRTSVFSGTAITGGYVDLYFKNEAEPFKKDIHVQSGGIWQVNVTLAAGEFDLEGVVRYGEARSDRVAHKITVVPNIPIIDSPRDGEALGRELFISGIGFRGDKITIDRRTHYFRLGSTEVKANGTWTFKANPNMVLGDGITAMAQVGAGPSSGYSPMLVNALLLKALPQITEPRVGDYVGIFPHFQGLATPNADITVSQWYDPTKVLASTTADEHGNWSAIGADNQELPLGPAWVIVRQTVDGQVSEWVESDYFVVERMPMEGKAPIVDYPPAGSEVGRVPLWAGRGLPWAEITVHPGDESLEVLGRTVADRYGNWTVRPENGLPVGDSLYAYSVRQRRDRVFSQRVSSNLKVIQVPIGFEAPTIERPFDDELQLLEQRPLFSGKARNGASIEILESKTGKRWALTTADAAGKWSVRIESELPEVATPYDFWGRQMVGGVYSSSSEKRSFKVANKVEPPVILSPASGYVVSQSAVIDGTALPGARIEIVGMIAEDGVPYEVILGEVVADAKGRWTIVVGNLPIRKLPIKTQAYLGEVSSGWSPTSFELDVRNIG